MLLLHAGNGGLPQGGGGGYTGPGDIVASALGWWGLRAYNAAYATGSNPAADVCDVAVGTTCSTINIKSDGSFDAATAAASAACTVACSVKTLYDQSGGGNNLIQSIVANRPVLSFSCIGSLPCMIFASHGLQKLMSVTQAQPFTISSVAERTGSFTSFNFIGPVADGNGLYFANAADTAETYCGSGITKAATDGAFHALHSICNGASSVIDVDNSTTTGNAGSGTNTANPTFGDTGNAYVGHATEMGWWGSAFSAGNITSMSANQHAYWGF